MKLEQQVTSLEISRKLKELGAKQESCFYWCEVDTTDDWDLRPAKSVFGKEIDYGNSYLSEVSAFTIAELGEMLAEQAEKFPVEKCIWFGSEKVGKYWECGSEKMLDHTFEDEFEADARGKMLIYLLENKLI